MNKKLLSIAAAAILLLVLALGGAWWWLGRPLYTLGVARVLIDAEVPLEVTDFTGRIDVGGGIVLHSFSEGEGPLAVVVPGGPGAPPTKQWPGLTGLARTHRVLYYHQRGSGESSRPQLQLDGSYGENVRAVDRVYGMAQHVADIERIRQRSGQERITLIGHSFGALIATLYAAEFPERIAKLVLLAPAAMLKFPNGDEDLFARVQRVLPPSRREAFESWRAHYLDFSPALFKKTDAQLVALQNEFAEYYLEAARLKGWQLPAEDSQARLGGWMVFGIYLSLGMHHDYRDTIRAASMTAPVAVVHFADDMQSFDVAEEYASLFENARVTEVDGAGHFAPMAGTNAIYRALAQAIEN